MDETRLVENSTAAIEAVEVSCSFEGVRALDRVSFAAQPGSIHALVGENGAGKSTLIKMMSGVLAPDSGVVRISGQNVRLGDPRAAQARGLRTVFQELTLLRWMTVAENLLLGVEPRGPTRFVRRREMADRAAGILARFDVHNIDPRGQIDGLPIAKQQIIEIVSALLHEPDILFLDEPTSALSESDVEWLFNQVRALQARGCCVVFTSHRWKEINDLATKITILRNGKAVATAPSFGHDEAVTLMTGRSLGEIYPAPPVPFSKPTGPPALAVRGLTSNAITDISFEVAPGEILGIGGLAGQGQRELFLTMFGASKALAGNLAIGGRTLRLRSPRHAIRAGMGIALVPEDRKHEGLFLTMSVRDNLTVSTLERVATVGVLRGRRERLAVDEIVRQLRIVTVRPALQQVQNLSGGNQQKALVGRWLLADAAIFLLFDITRGVDIGTKQELYELMVSLAATGKSLVVYSTEAEELAHLCHRVLVMREGRVVSELSGADLVAERLVHEALHSTDSVKVPAP